MRAHESWCASRYRYENQPPAACDCGAEQEQAQQLAPFNPLAGGKKHQKRKPTWAGKLPVQFCLKCEGPDVKRVAIVPRDGGPERVFAACLDIQCTHIRELEPPAN